MALLQLCVLGLYVTVIFVMQMTTNNAYGQLTCACTTPACNDTGHVTCSAVTSCYTQYLDRRDGSPPVTRGCIDDKTPLLCENRRPFVPVTPWPHLRCCKESMCNADVGIVTAPTWPKKYFQSTTAAAQVFQLEAHSYRNSNQPAQKPEPRTEENFQHPLFIIVLPVVTLCLFLILIIVAVVVIRQSRRRHRTGEFGANVNAAGLPAGHCRGTFYCTGDPYIREKFFRSVPV